jgi:hypothetical protein
LERLTDFDFGKNRPESVLTFFPDKKVTKKSRANAFHKQYGIAMV